MHAGYDPDGNLRQWVCFPEHHDGLTDEQRAVKRSDDVRVVRGQATRDLYAA